MFRRLATAILVCAACTDPYGAEPPPAPVVDAGPNDAGEDVSTPPIDAGSDAFAGPCHALSFDGADDFVTVPDAPDLDFAGPHTLEAWVELANVTQGERHIVSHHNHDLAKGYVLMALPELLADGGKATHAVARFYDGANAFNHGNTASVVFPTQKWTHVAVSYDGARVAIYVNGARVYDAATAASIDFAGPLTIGRSAASNYFHWAGRIDEVRLSKVARYEKTSFVPAVRFEPDADTIALWHFDEGTGTVAHDTMGKHDGTIMNGAVWNETPCGQR